MPGAGSMTAVHYLDITGAEGRHRPRHLQLRQYRRFRGSTPDKVKVDFRKFNWIGSISQDLTVCYVWHGLGVKTLAELKARPKVHHGLDRHGHLQRHSTSVS